ncbi:AAA family ATPase [Runella limosa]|uniref:AAA family ATPase n=1 Tax=Runella limosa TaxID=370978 RepID=UPI000421438D|nr:AAA family ATPase [Runella limosa]
MYIKQVHIQNIRSIESFEMVFEQPAGWHVIIGDNGAGKSSVVRAIALALVGPKEVLGLRADWREWLNRNATEGEIALSLESGMEDKHTGRQGKLKNERIPNVLQLKRINGMVELREAKDLKPDPFKYNWGHGNGWFSVAYGPFRRFAGGNPEWAKVFYSQPKLGAHLSVFGEDVALTEALEWLVKLNYQVLEQKEEGDIIDDIKKLVNSPNFLPHSAIIDSISSEGVIFKDGYGTTVHVNQMSDGYRSILSLTFELIRQLIRIYGANTVFRTIRKGNMVIDLPGVVLIDEVDAHLHPTWQTKIGQWFTQYFPNIQFIVTTHSPLICRTAENGTIWRLAAPNSTVPSGLVDGIHRERLIFGNVLDAYSTEVFGKSVTISTEANDKRTRLGELNIKSLLGTLSKNEEGELTELKKIFPTEKTLEG